MNPKDLSNNNVSLSEEIHLLITSNYEGFVDPLYEKCSEFVIESIILYLEQIYGQKINKNIAIQEIINLFMYFSKYNYTGSFFWEKIKKETDYKCTPIDMLSDKAKNNLFGYLSVSITSGFIDGVFIEEKNFIPKISCEVFFDNENNLQMNILEIQKQLTFDVSIEDISDVVPESEEGVRNYTITFNDIKSSYLPDYMISMSVSNISDKGHMKHTGSFVSLHNEDMPINAYSKEEVYFLVDKSIKNKYEFGLIHQKDSKDIYFCIKHIHILDTDLIAQHITNMRCIIKEFIEKFGDETYREKNRVEKDFA